LDYGRTNTDWKFKSCKFACKHHWHGGVEKHSNISTRKVFDKFADFCNKLPFSGKVIINPVTALAFKEKNPYYKTIKAIEAEGLLGAMALAHASQAMMGITNVQRNVEVMKHNPSPEVLLACGIDVAYTAANVAATYAQLHLGGRLAEHFLKTKDRAVPRLEAWGINGDKVNYDVVAEKLMTAIVNENQADIDTFFMILPKDKKQKAMESVKMITDVVDETYSYEEVDNQIKKLDRDVEKKSKFRYLLDIVINSHIDSLVKFKQPYSFKEQMKMIVVTLGGQIGFLGWG